LSEENVDGVNVGHEHEAFMMGTLLLLTRDTQHNAATQQAGKTYVKNVVWPNFLLTKHLHTTHLSSI